MNVLLWCDSYMYARISANCPDVSPAKELLLPASLIGVLSLDYSKRAPTWRSYFNWIKTRINMDYWIKAWTHFIRLRLMMQVLIRQLLQGAVWSESEGFDAEQYTLLNKVVIKYAVYCLFIINHSTCSMINANICLLDNSQSLHCWYT